MRRLPLLLCLPALSVFGASDALDTSPGTSLTADPTAAAPYVVNPLPGPSAPAPVETATHAAAADKAAEWIVAPIPGYDPSQGANIKVLAQYVFAADKDAPAGEPKDVIGFGGFYSEEKSRGLAGAYSGSLDHDTWRLLALAGAGRLNYDFYGVGTGSGSAGRSIPVEQDMGFGLVRAMRRLHADLFGGLRAQALVMDSRAPHGSRRPRAAAVRTPDDHRRTRPGASMGHA